MNNYPENDYRNYISHSFLGSTWNKATKYLFKKNGRYYYPGDVAEATARSEARNRTAANKTGSADYAASDKNRKNKVSRTISSIGNTIKRAAGAPQRALNTRRSKAILRESRNYGSADYASGTSRKERLKSLARGLRYSVSRGVSTAGRKGKTALASLKPKNINRNIYKKTGVNVASTARNTATSVKNAYERKKKAAVQQDRTLYRLTGKNKYQRGLEGVGRKGKTALASLKPTNINRNIYKKTGVNVGSTARNAASAVKSRATNWYDEWKNKRKAKKNTKLTGGGAR